MVLGYNCGKDVGVISIKDIQEAKRRIEFDFAFIGNTVTLYSCDPVVMCMCSFRTFRTDGRECCYRLFILRNVRLR